MAFGVLRVPRFVRHELLAITVSTSLLLTASLSAAPVDDSTRAAARRLGSAGVEAFQQRDYKTANDKLGRAFRVLQAPTLGLWSARALEKLGRLVEAQERYLMVTRLAIEGGDTEVQKKAQAEAAVDLASLSPRVPTIVVQVEGASPTDVALTIDGAVLSAEFVGEVWPLDPGSHQVVGVRGSERIEAELVVAESEHKTTVLRFGTSPAAAATGPAPARAEVPVQAAGPARDAGSGISQRTIGWITVGAGVAGFALGGVAGTIALADRGGLHQAQGAPAPDDCYATSCGTAAKDKVDAYNGMRTLSSVGFIAGGVLAATGVVLILTAPHSTSTSSTALIIQPSALLVRGAF